MTQLAAIASETHEKAIAYFKVAEQYGYKFIMEVKEMRDKQYYKALGFDSFDAYCENSWNITRDFMDQRIQIAESLGNEREFADSYRKLGHSKSLILARMEPQRRQDVMTNPQLMPNGEEKTVDEMTVRQLKQLEKERDDANRKAEQAVAIAESLDKDLKHTKSRLNSELNRPLPHPQTIEKPPADYNEAKAKAARLEQVEQELIAARNLAEQYKKDSGELKEMKGKIEFLHREKNDLHRQIDSATALSGLSVEIDNLLKTKLAPVRYSRALERLDSEIAVRNLTEIIESVEHWCEDMRRYVPKNNRKVVIDYDPAG